MGAGETAQEKQIAARHVVRTAAIAALGGLFFGYDTGIIASALLFIETDFAPLSFEPGLVVTAVPIGAVFGAALADRPLGPLRAARQLILARRVVFIVGARCNAVAVSPRPCW